MPRSTRPLQEHPEVLPVPPVDPQERYLHLKRCNKEGVSISTLLSRVPNTQGVKGITKFKEYEKNTSTPQEQFNSVNQTTQFNIYNFIPNFTIFNNYMNAHERVTHSHTMHYCSRAFTEGYASAPKYTPHSESSRGKLLGLSPQGSLSLLNSPHTGFHFSSLFHFFPFHTLFTIFMILFIYLFFSHNHDAMNATIPMFLNNSTISTFPNNPIKQFHTLQFPIISQINIKKKIAYQQS